MKLKLNNFYFSTNFKNMLNENINLINLINKKTFSGSTKIPDLKINDIFKENCEDIKGFQLINPIEYLEVEILVKDILEFLDKEIFNRTYYSEIYKNYKTYSFIEEFIAFNDKIFSPIDNPYASYRIGKKLKKIFENIEDYYLQNFNNKIKKSTVKLMKSKKRKKEMIINLFTLIKYIKILNKILEELEYYMKNLDKYYLKYLRFENYNYIITESNNAKEINSILILRPNNETLYINKELVIKPLSKNENLEENKKYDYYLYIININGENPFKFSYHIEEISENEIPKEFHLKYNKKLGLLI